MNAKSAFWRPLWESWVQPLVPVWMKTNWARPDITFIAVYLQRYVVLLLWRWRTSCCRPLPAEKDQCLRAPPACSPAAKVTLCRETGRPCAWAQGTGLQMSKKSSVQVTVCVCVGVRMSKGGCVSFFLMKKFTLWPLGSEVSVSAKACKLRGRIVAGCLEVKDHITRSGRVGLRCSVYNILHHLVWYFDNGMGTVAWWIKCQVIWFNNHFLYWKTVSHKAAHSAEIQEAKRNNYLGTFKGIKICAQQCS